jgi:hypothetical protein
MLSMYIAPLLIGNVWIPEPFTFKWFGVQRPFVFRTYTGSNIRTLQFLVGDCFAFFLHSASLQFARVDIKFEFKVLDTETFRAITMMTQCVIYFMAWMTYNKSEEPAGRVDYTDIH